MESIEELVDEHSKTSDSEGLHDRGDHDCADDFRNGADSDVFDLDVHLEGIKSGAERSRFSAAMPPESSNPEEPSP